MAGKKQASSRGASKSTSTRPSQKPGPQQPATTTQTPERAESAEELRRQQTLLDVFSNTFRDVLGAADFSAQLQAVKTALFNRDFEGAFARGEAALDVYAARWSPTRALCYARVLRGLDSHLKDLARNTSDHSSRSAVDRDAGDRDENAEVQPEDPTTATEHGGAERGAESRPLRILAIGGAAAEIVAFADYISSHDNGTSPRVEVTLFDIGPWGSIVRRLHTALTSTPPISRYASASARSANKALVAAESLQSRFVQKDILSLDEAELSALISGQAMLITLLFTLNELYTASGIKRTTSFLRLLSALAPENTLLLVIDSPGSYSEAAVGRDAKRYPMQWLLDHTLVPPAPNPRREMPGDAGEREPGCKWEKIESCDSVWFRVAEGLRYPIPLENMRYQMHLYRASIS
ncbi:hypothetical protein GQX73_g3980 [Xylaria multiplex]|uniref:25S rRNA (Uridine(2843)-N(3))-methyltransferase n=1 Tax=Xylaria multiplex TaxID=323545 RepID=A0A7C8ITL6_9PEZI|nr:hypothetical protein GQX73_g3980 [Xylaria multiplex]